jgi:hypothetical protein
MKNLSKFGLVLLLQGCISDTPQEDQIGAPIEDVVSEEIVAQLVPFPYVKSRERLAYVKLLRECTEKLRGIEEYNILENNYNGPGSRSGINDYEKSRISTIYSVEDDKHELRFTVRKLKGRESQHFTYSRTDSGAPQCDANNPGKFVDSYPRRILIQAPEDCSGDTSFCMEHRQAELDFIQALCDTYDFHATGLSQLEERIEIDREKVKNIVLPKLVKNAVEVMEEIDIRYCVFDYDYTWSGEGQFRNENTWGQVSFHYPPYNCSGASLEGSIGVSDDSGIGRDSIRYNLGFPCPGSQPSIGLTIDTADFGDQWFFAFNEKNPEWEIVAPLYESQTSKFIEWHRHVEKNQRRLQACYEGP